MRKYTIQKKKEKPARYTYRFIEITKNIHHHSFGKHNYHLKEFNSKFKRKNKKEGKEKRIKERRTKKKEEQEEDKTSC